MSEMGLVPGDDVMVAYLTADGSRNTYNELYLSEDGLEYPVSEELPSIMIPSSLMKQARLEDKDIKIACLDGCIAIYEDRDMNLWEMQQLRDNLRIANELVQEVSEILI